MKKISKNLKSNNPNIPSIDKTNNEITLKTGGQRKREWFGIDFNQNKYYNKSGSEVSSSDNWSYCIQDGMLCLKAQVSALTFINRSEKEALDGYIGRELPEKQFFNIFKRIEFDNIKTVDGNDCNTLYTPISEIPFPILNIVYNNIYDLNSVYNSDFNKFKDNKYRGLISIEINEPNRAARVVQIYMASDAFIYLENFLGIKGVIGRDWINNENAEEIYHTIIRMISGSDVVYKKSFDGVSRHGAISFNINYSD